MPEISIIVPVYNAEKWLSYCIDSIMNQTFSDFELLLIDDGSTDGSGKICDEYSLKDSRIRVFHKTNEGVSSARNLGLDNASGEWIAFCDADDWIEQDMIKILLDRANEKNVDIVFCDFWFNYPKSQIPFQLYDWVKQGSNGLKEYLATTWTCLCGSIQKKKLYDNNKLRSCETIKYCEDFHLMVRLCFFADKIAKVPTPLYHYRQQESSIIHNLDKKTEADEQWVYADTIEFFKAYGVYDKYKESMAWRSLKASQELALDIRTFGKFRDYNPDKKDYIFTCPFIGKKLKIIMWCLSHNMSWLAWSIIRVRTILRR